MASSSNLDKRKLEQMIRTQPQVTGQWLRMVSVEMVGDLKESMLDSPASGATYSRGEGRTHTASSPGNPPRPDMGVLINTVRERSVKPFHRVIEVGTEYALPLEFGTTRVQARPFMRPLFEAWRDKIGKHAQDNLFS